MQLDPNDSLSEYYLGLQFAINNSGNISEAIRHVQMSLDLRSESSTSLHLMVLLLSANRQHEEALQLVEAGLEEYPDCLNLMYVKAHLELHEEGGEVKCSFEFNVFKSNTVIFYATRDQHVFALMKRESCTKI